MTTTRKPTTTARSSANRNVPGNSTKSASSTRPNGKASSTLELPSIGQQYTTLVKSGRDVTQRQFEAGLELTAGNIEKVNKRMMKNFEEMTGSGKEAFEAYVSYCTTWTKGYEEISKTYMTTMQNMAQQWMQCCKSMITAKTMKEAMDTQGDYMRTQFDTVLAEGTKISELCVKLATEASEPVQTQWNQMVSKYGKAA